MGAGGRRLVAPDDAPLAAAGPRSAQAGLRAHESGGPRLPPEEFRAGGGGPPHVRRSRRGREGAQQGIQGNRRSLRADREVQGAVAGALRQREGADDAAEAAGRARPPDGRRLAFVGTRQIGGTQMEFLRAVGRFILAQLAILGFLLLAPAILVGVSLFAIAGGAGSNPGFLAFFYMAAGPFVSAVWTAFFMSLRRVLRTTTFSNRTAASCGMRVQIASCGWALVGFLGSIAAEV